MAARTGCPGGPAGLGWQPRLCPARCHDQDVRCVRNHPSAAALLRALGSGHAASPVLRTDRVCGKRIGGYRHRGYRVRRCARAAVRAAR